MTASRPTRSGTLRYSERCLRERAVNQGDDAVVELIDRLGRLRDENTRLRDETDAAYRNGFHQGSRSMESWYEDDA